MCIFSPTSIPKSGNPAPPWWSKGVSRAIKAKHSLYKRYVRSKPHADYLQYAAQRNLVKSKVRSAQISYERSLLKNMQSNPKAFYSYVKSKQRIKSSIGPLEKADGSPTIDDHEVAADRSPLIP